MSTPDDSTARPAAPFLREADAIERIFEHIDNGTTDVGDTIWREPVEHYFSQERFEAEIALLRRLPVPYCPSAALTEPGNFVARTAAGTPLLVVRGKDGAVRAFINACRHRGMQVATGMGNANSFSCPYHAWTYNLAGELRAIPGKEGFDNLDPLEYGLAEVSAAERGGIVYVQQEGIIAGSEGDQFLDYLSPTQALFETDELEDEANWKILNETLQEGYHIKSLHRETFFPYGLDNTNLVEIYGANSRIIFPFRRIESIREVPAEQRRFAGVATVVYHLFPNASVLMLSKHTNLVILEPLSPTRTKWVIYRMFNEPIGDESITLEEAQRDVRFVNDFGQDEDRDRKSVV